MPHGRRYQRRADPRRPEPAQNTSTQKPDTTPPQTTPTQPSSGEGGILFSCPTITLYPGGTCSLSVLEHNMRSASGVTWANESPDLLQLNGNGSSVTALAERGTGYLTTFPKSTLL